MASERERIGVEVVLGRDRPLDGLRTITEARGTLDRLERMLTCEARERWATWAEIGSEFGISRQAAFVRYRRFVNATDGDSPGDSPRRSGDSPRPSN